MSEAQLTVPKTIKSISVHQGRNKGTMGSATVRGGWRGGWRWRRYGGGRGRQRSEAHLTSTKERRKEIRSKDPTLFEPFGNYATGNRGGEASLRPRGDVWLDVASLPPPLPPLPPLPARSVGPGFHVQRYPRRHHESFTLPSASLTPALLSAPITVAQNLLLFSTLEPPSGGHSPRNVE